MERTDDNPADGVRLRVAGGFCAAALLLAGCGEAGAVPPQPQTLDEGDTLTGQGVEIVSGRFVPELVSVDAAQPVNFVNRDDVPHRIVKVSGPGRSFHSEVIAPGERYKLSLLGRPGWKLRAGIVIYRSTAPGHPRGRISVTGTLLPRRTDASGRPPPWSRRPEHPDWAARRRARDLAPWVSQCRDYRRCDSGEELVRNVNGGHGVRFVFGSSRSAIESAIATNGRPVRIGSDADETEVHATLDVFTIVSHSRSGRDYVLRGRARDPATWSHRWRRAR